MAIRRLQNKIAGSHWALPLTAIYGVAIVVALGAIEQQMWAQTALLVLSTLLMVELNNANALIRIYSRMVSCSFLVLTLMAAFLFPSIEGGIVGMAVGPIYTAFLALGIASLFFVQIFYFVPLFWLLMAVRLQAFSLRTFCASLLGLITPYWFLAVYFLYQADYDTPQRHFAELVRFAQPAIIDIPQHTHQLATFAFIVVLTFTGIIHFLRQRSKDKLRTQMIYELFLAVTLFTVVFLILQPQHNDFLLRILIIHTAVFIGHFVSLTHTKITNIAFIAILVLTLAMTVFNLVHS